MQLFFFVGKEKHEVGKTKSIAANPCRSSHETFGKFVTTATDDPYEDPGKFNQQLRGATPQKQRPQTASFKTMHPNNRTVKKSEFEYMAATDEPKGAAALKTFTARPGGFYNRKTAEPFTQFKGIAYMEDPYERKEDMQREEYARLNSKILHKNQPFSQTVKQRGTFYPRRMTYGTSHNFPVKPVPLKQKPAYGSFKSGDPAHVGHNKTFGGGAKSTEYQYVEECEQDPVKYQRDVKNPVWYPTTQMSKSMATTTIQNHFRNSAK